MRKKTFAVLFLAGALGFVLLFSACGGGKSSAGGSSGVVQGQPSTSPASVTSEMKLVTELTGGDHTYFTAGDAHYHLYPDCTLISGTAQEGTVAQALAANPGSSLCVSCISRALNDGAAGGVTDNTATGNTGQTGTDTTTKPASGVIAPTAKYAAKPATVNVADGLNLRKGPGTNYDKIAGIPDKTKVSDIGNSSAQPDWVYIQYGTTEGWVAKKYLKY